jgi:hypothetical protein
MFGNYLPSEPILRERKVECARWLTEHIVAIEDRIRFLSLFVLIEAYLIVWGAWFVGYPMHNLKRVSAPTPNPIEFFTLFI